MAKALEQSIRHLSSQPNNSQSEANNLEALRTQLGDIKTSIKTKQEAKWKTSFQQSPKIWKCLSLMYQQNGTLKRDLAGSLGLLAIAGLLTTGVALVATGTLTPVGVLLIIFSIGLSKEILEVMFDIHSARMAHYHKTHQPNSVLTV